MPDGGPLEALVDVERADVGPGLDVSDQRVETDDASDATDAIDERDDGDADISVLQKRADGPDAPGGEDTQDGGPPDMPERETSGDGATDESGDGDSGGDCGVGCPSHVSPDDLKLWLAADWGVACDTPTGRVVSWRDRADQTRMFSPTSGHVGPLCGTVAQAWAGRTVPFFDRSGTDDQDSVLPIDLTALVGHDYTIFVVERRRSSAVPAYLLGAAAPDSTTLRNCGSLGNAYKTYRFGYFDEVVFRASAYSVTEDEESCTDVKAPYAPFLADHPAASLDVEVFSQLTGHLLAFGTGDGVVGDDTHVIDSLQDGQQYLGRAYQHVDEDPDARFYGEIAELVIYQAALDDASRQAVSRYLMDRWAVANPSP